MSFERIKNWLESPAVIVTGWLISAILGAGGAYLGMVLYLSQFVDGRIEMSPRWNDMKVGAASVLPAGALAFFDRAKGCPTGWKDVGALEGDVFAGRVLVATGTHVDRVRRKYRQTGGSEAHRLGIEEMAPHEHRVISSTEFLWLRSDALGHPSDTNVKKFELVRDFDPANPDTRCRDCGPDYKETALETTKSGGMSTSSAFLSRPHNNMPPFVAVFLCRKE